MIIVFVTFIAYIARNLGKKAELNMVKRLGGLPTTILIVNPVSDKLSRVMT